jgi:PAS domain S-box-containing protein
VENEKQYRLLFESNPQPMYVIDDETLALLAVNDAAVHHYGSLREEFLG